MKLFTRIPTAQEMLDKGITTAHFFNRRIIFYATAIYTADYAIVKVLRFIF